MNITLKYRIKFIVSNLLSSYLLPPPNDWNSLSDSTLFSNSFIGIITILHKKNFVLCQDVRYNSDAQATIKVILVLVIYYGWIPRDGCYLLFIGHVAENMLDEGKTTQLNSSKTLDKPKKMFENRNKLTNEKGPEKQTRLWQSCTHEIDRVTPTLKSAKKCEKQWWMAHKSFGHWTKPDDEVLYLP